MSPSAANVPILQPSCYALEAFLLQRCPRLCLAVSSLHNISVTVAAEPKSNAPAIAALSADQLPSHLSTQIGRATTSGLCLLLQLASHDHVTDSFKTRRKKSFQAAKISGHAKLRLGVRSRINRGLQRGYLISNGRVESEWLMTAVA